MKKFLLLFFIVLLTFTVAFAGRYSQALCNNSDYLCYTVKSGDTWSRLFPDPKQEDLVRRINRSSTSLYRGLKIAIPVDLHRTDLFDHAPFPNRIDPKGQKVIIIEMKYQAFGAYDENGNLVHWGPVSGGKGWCPDVHRYCNTPRGTYRFTEKRGPGCFSTKYPFPEGGAPMPYCMFFRNGYAMHAGDLPGYHASHGCVRLFYRDAEWLNRQFVDLGKKGTMVIVR
jgi:hypothetical protein